MNLRFIILILLMTMLVGCGGQAAPVTNSEGEVAETAAGAEAGPAISESEPDSVEAAAFPVTIEHKYGSTEITARPERVVTIGLTDHDTLLALGIVPVGTSEWFGDYPGAIWPWAQDKLDDAPFDPRTGAPLCIPYVPSSTVETIEDFKVIKTSNYAIIGPVCLSL